MALNRPRDPVPAKAPKRPAEGLCRRNVCATTWMCQRARYQPPYKYRPSALSYHLSSCTSPSTGIHPHVSIMATATSTATSLYTIPTVISSTNRGAMLTPVPLPTDCLKDAWNFQAGGLIQMDPSFYTYFTQGCAISSCCPSSTPYSNSYQWLSTYYSPAVCPQSYQTCLGPPAEYLTPESGETVMFCCPE